MTEQVTQDEMIQKIKKKETPKPSAITTMMVSTNVKGTNHILTQMLPNFSLRTITDKFSIDLILYTDKLQNLTVGMNYTVSALATKDPTPCNAFSSISLGYFRHRWLLRDAKLINMNPPTFRGWKENYETDILLEMWE